MLRGASDLVGEEDGGEAQERWREVERGDPPLAPVARGDAALRVHQALAPEHGVVGARDGQHRLAVLEEVAQVLEDHLRVGGQVARDHVA